MKYDPEQQSKDKEYTGLSVSYYSVLIKTPTTPNNPPYVAECNDIIEALGMNYAEGNAFKAIWRMCAARKGLSKKGYKDGFYDAEKVVFFGNRLMEQYKNVLTTGSISDTVANLGKIKEERKEEGNARVLVACPFVGSDIPCHYPSCKCEVEVTKLK